MIKKNINSSINTYVSEATEVISQQAEIDAILQINKEIPASRNMQLAEGEEIFKEQVKEDDTSVRTQNPTIQKKGPTKVVVSKKTFVEQTVKNQR